MNLIAQAVDHPFEFRIMPSCKASVMKLVDMRDSKSLVLRDVAVRVRPLVPQPSYPFVIL